MESRALAGDVAGANAEYQKVVTGLQGRKTALDGTIPTQTDPEQKARLDNERAAVVAYLGCLSEQVYDGLCQGLACWQVQQCREYKANDVPRCEALDS